MNMNLFQTAYEKQGSGLLEQRRGSQGSVV